MSCVYTSSYAANAQIQIEKMFSILKTKSFIVFLYTTVDSHDNCPHFYNPKQGSCS